MGTETLSENSESCGFWSAKATAFALACGSDSFHPEKHLWLFDTFKKHQLALVLNKAVVGTTALQRSRGTHNYRTASLSPITQNKPQRHNEHNVHQTHCIFHRVRGVVVVKKYRLFPPRQLEL